MPNAGDASVNATKRILVVGPSGSGKTSQMWTLPGRKFLYRFDPNALSTIKGNKEIDYEDFLPDIAELDASLKGFNKGAKDDAVKDSRGRKVDKEPTTYLKWVDDLNEKGASGFFNNYQWLCVDGLTHLAKAAMQRQLYINGRYGDVEELADYRVVGSKLTSVFESVCSTELNIFMCAHMDTYQDEKTQRIITQIRSPGSSRAMLPLIFTDIWGTEYDLDKQQYLVRTKPDKRGLKDIRCSMSGVPELVDVTIPGFPSNRGGIGALLEKYNR